ncbi:MAG TPA: GGDEF domain-containing protein [Acidimicrobiales bacterium]|nr:GGDEF domain-containing protein [Acidimicrobiales bacterium]
MEPRAVAKTSTRRMVLAAAAVVSVTYVLVDRLVTEVTGNTVVDIAIEGTVLAAVTVAALWLAVIRPLRREADGERRVTAEREELLRVEAERQEFGGRLHRALEMAATEEAAYRATSKALAGGLPAVGAELLLADSSDAHLKRAVATEGDGRARCAVVSPRDCPAIRRAQTLQFASSDDIDACPFLEDRPGGECSATCVPVSVGGRSIGVLHAATAPSVPVSKEGVARLEAIATQAGSRIGMLRVMAATHLQAATDPLTGLLNRRSFENQAQELLRKDLPFALAMGDLDHFKALNDTHGHEAGDRALRLFARTLRAALRSDDLACRYGGEEFVIAFPGCTTAEAVAALERVQENLMLALAAGTVPGFTASFGVAHTTDASSLEDLARVADGALFRAKRQGRNRVVADADSVGS